MRFTLQARLGGMLVLVLALSSLAFGFAADDTPAKRKRPVPKEQVEKWLQDLVGVEGAPEPECHCDHDRPHAAKELKKAGKHARFAIDQIAKIAEEKTNRSSELAIEVLTFYLDSDDDATSEDAVKAMSKIAKCSNKPAAERAADALDAWDFNHPSGLSRAKYKEIMAAIHKQFGMPQGTLDIQR